jgi:hypothetical protein
MKSLVIPPNIKKYFSLRFIMFSWYRHYKILFFGGFVVVFGIGSVVWYRYLHTYQWSDESKQQFIEQHFKETVFKEKQFDTLVIRLDERASSHEETPELTRDLFSGQSIK